MTPLGGAPPPRTPPPLLSDADGAGGDFLVVVDSACGAVSDFLFLFEVPDGNMLVSFESVSPPVTSYCLHNVLAGTYN